MMCTPVVPYCINSLCSKKLFNYCFIELSHTSILKAQFCAFICFNFFVRNGTIHFFFSQNENDFFCDNKIKLACN